MEKQTKAALLARARALRRETDQMLALQGRTLERMSREPEGVMRLRQEVIELERQAENLK